jgi:hypothetical protein
MDYWKWTKRAGTTALGATTIIGLLHLPMARPLLARLGECPVRATPTEIEQARRIALRALRGTDPAPARPALGFTLETTTLADVQAWARTRGIACAASMSDTLVKCDAVPAGAVTTGASGTFDEIAFGFRLADHRLVNLTTLSGGMNVSAAATRFTAVAGTLAGALGAPTSERLPTSTWNAGGPVFVQYRYADYLAGISAMELPGRGVVVREHYMSARDDDRRAAAPIDRHAS